MPKSLEPTDFTPWGMLILVCQFVLTLWIWKLQSYTRKKGENQADKEDLREITQLVESVKLKNEKELTKLRAHLDQSSALAVHLHKERWELAKDYFRGLIMMVNPALELIRLNSLPERNDLACVEFALELRVAATEFHESVTWRLPLMPLKMLAIGGPLHDACLSLLDEELARHSGESHPDPRQLTVLSGKIRGLLTSLSAEVKAYVDEPLK